MPVRPKVVILGGGFAGLRVLKDLDKDLYEVHLVDRNNYHSFPPLFYQVASSGLDPTDISFPFRRRLRQKRMKDARFHLGEVKSVDMYRRTVITDNETIGFDILVIAMGTTNNFFGNPDLVDKVYTLKSTGEAIRLRNEVLYRCERAAIEKDPVKRKKMLTFAVIGGGPAGVEVAGAMGELKRYVISRDFPELSPLDITIHLIEGSDRLLRTMSIAASQTALADLGKLMVNITLNRTMKSYDGNVITLDDGTTIECGLVTWTAGVKAVPFDITGIDNPDTLFGHGGRIITDDRCRVKGLEGVFAIGDIGIFESDSYPHGLPQLAQVAIQAGAYAAQCLNSKSWTKPFSYKDKGSMATIGRNKAVADIKGTHLSGFTAWLAWMFIHLISLLGMRSKLTVLLNWTWAYFTYNTALRLLLKGSKYPLRGDIDDNG